MWARKRWRRSSSRGSAAAGSRNDDGSPRTDCGGHCRPFAEVGLPTAVFRHDPLDYDTRTHHTNMDTYEHLIPDDQVVVVTGSWCDLASALCNALCLEGVKVVGSTRRLRMRGWVADVHCVGAHKVRMLKEAGVGPPWSVVYTDSASDLPLLHLAERRCVVNATPAALKTLNRALGAETLEVVRWK